MAMQMFEVEKTQSGYVGNSAAWRYAADEKELRFMSNYGGVPDIVCDGDWLGQKVAFYANGRKSRFCGKVVEPRDERRKTLWKHGFRKNSFVTLDEIKKAGSWNDLIEIRCGRIPGSGYGYNEYNQFVNDANVRREIVMSGNDIMVATAHGREYNSNRTVIMAYLSPEATPEHVAIWEQQFLNQ